MEGAIPVLEDLRRRQLIGVGGGSERHSEKEGEGGEGGAWDVHVVWAFNRSRTMFTT